jgi:hypothetical protein
VTHRSFVTIKKQSKLFAKIDAGFSVKTASFSQKLLRDEIYKITFDCDDEAPDEKSMIEQTLKIVAWAQGKLCALLGIDADELAIHSASREVDGHFKVSVGIVVTTWKCVLVDQWEYLVQQGVVASVPDALGKDCIIDKKIYRTGQLRLVNCHKPRENPAGIKKPLTFIRNPLAHVPSCLMDVCGSKKVMLVAPARNVDIVDAGVDYGSESASDGSDIGNDDMFSRGSLNTTAADVMEMLGCIDPDIDYAGYFAIACFLKNHTDSLFENSKEVFQSWMKKYKDPSHQHRVAKAGAFFDGCAGMLNYAFRTLVYRSEINVLNNLINIILFTYLEW